MHFPSTYLGLALALTTTSFATPTRQNPNDYSEPSVTAPFGTDSTGTLPAQCAMFKHYVPEAVIDAVCSMHMTPGAVPTMGAGCFGGGGGGGGGGAIPQPTYVANTYEAVGTSVGPVGDVQPTLTGSGGGDVQPTPTSAGSDVQSAGGNDEQPTNTRRGAQATTY
ncbi:MAG: hypothetical protein Q9219_005106 [cf. Caloplaca sp. 3 TL-2023]